jgi:glucose-1-phosphate cytidylyltransferase
MKVVLFCAGQGTRIRDYSQELPKPMIPIDGQPILGHVLDFYSSYGHQDFVLCLGYKSEVIRSYFRGGRSGHVTVERETVHTESGDTVTLVETGRLSNLGQRLWAVKDLVKDEEMFMANYSDGLTDVDMDEVLERFKQSGKIACFLAVRPALTYHVADLAEDGTVNAIVPARQSEIWINGGYFIFRPEIFDFMREGEELVVEPFQRLIEANQLMAFRHEGFWQSMDTVRDHALLEGLVTKGCMPWKAHSTAKSGQELEVVAL